MLLRKIKLMGLLCLTISLISFAKVTVAANETSSNFMIRLFNNTDKNELLRYFIISKGQTTIEGVLAAGDDHGQAIKIYNKASEARAEVIIKDMANHILWDGSVTYYGTQGDFYTTTISLDSHYNVGTHAFPTIQQISFDIHS